MLDVFSHKIITFHTFLNNVLLEYISTEFDTHLQGTLINLYTNHEVFGLHCRTWNQVPIQIQIPNPMGTLYYAQHCMDLDLDFYQHSDPQLLLDPFLRLDIRTLIGIQVRVRQYK